jgi:hypothetical protein
MNLRGLKESGRPGKEEEKGTGASAFQVFLEVLRE